MKNKYLLIILIFLTSCGLAIPEIESPFTNKYKIVCIQDGKETTFNIKTDIPNLEGEYKVIIEGKNLDMDGHCIIDP